MSDANFIAVRCTAPAGRAGDMMNLDSDHKYLLQHAIALVKMRAPGITVQTEVQSPCISVCRISDNSGLCMGCFRTGDEIASWSSASDDGKRGIWKLIEQRMDGSLPPYRKNPL